MANNFSLFDKLFILITILVIGGGSVPISEKHGSRVRGNGINGPMPELELPKPEEFIMTNQEAESKMRGGARSANLKKMAGLLRPRSFRKEGEKRQDFV